MHDSIASRVWMSLKKNNTTKRNKTVEYVGCPIPDLKVHLEKYFVHDPIINKTYSWKNKGKGGWDIDHIVPINYFVKEYDYTNFEIQKIVWHFTNLQPLWANLNRNIKKGNIKKISAEKKIKLIKKFINEKITVNQYWTKYRITSESNISDEVNEQAKKKISN